MTLRVVGQYKGSITLELDTATVLELKEAVSRDSGLAVAGLKLLAGGKHLKDDASTLARYGITPGKTIMVLRQDLSELVQAEASLTQRTEEVAQAASMLSARAARDIGAGGRGNAWGDWRQGGLGGRRQGRGRGSERSGDDRPQIELTNQDGEAMASPAEDSAALMEGMMLHRRGLACISNMSTATSSSATEAAAVAAAPSAHSKIPRRRLRATLTGTASLAAEAPTTITAATSTSSTATTSLIGNDASAGVESAEKEPPKNVGVKESGWEERKESRPQEKSEERQNTKQGGVMLFDSSGAREPSVASASVAEEDEKDAGMFNQASATAVAPGKDDASANSGGEEGQGRSDVKGKGKFKPEAPVSSDVGHRRGLAASQKQLRRREALGLLMRADEAFRRCDPKYLECVDNYAYLCLDVVWLLFLMKDLSNLDLASRMLGSVERGFCKAHGPGLQRLTALKGEYCAEKLLYVRLHLLQGVVAFLQGESGKASGLLIRASEEAKTLKPNPVLASRLMQQWNTVKFEVLQPKVALLALRAGRNDLDAAWQYLESLRQRQDTVRKERALRMKQRRAGRFGFTADKRGFVDAALVEQLVKGGFSRSKAISALRQHNNDVGAALASLTSSRAESSESADANEALAILQSLGVPLEEARVVLGRTGTLCNALCELGIDAPEGNGSVGRGSSGARRQNGREGGTGGNESDGDGTSSDEDEAGDSLEEREDADESEPTPEETKLFNELVADRGNQDDEGYLDVTLEDEADAADMYLHLCRGDIPVAFDLDKVRAGIAAAVATERAGKSGR